MRWLSATRKDACPTPSHLRMSATCSRTVGARFQMSSLSFSVVTNAIQAPSGDQTRSYDMPVMRVTGLGSSPNWLVCRQV